MEWKTNIKFVDINTGEELTKFEARLNYTIKKIKTEHHANQLTQKGTKFVIYECIKSNQITIFDQTTNT